jgi:hypothetical protein
MSFGALRSICDRKQKVTLLYMSSKPIQYMVTEEGGVAVTVDFYSGGTLFKSQSGH